MAYYVEKNKANIVWANLASGTYDGEQNVTLTKISNNANAQIVYTTDGTEPTANSKKSNQWAATNNSGRYNRSESRLTCRWNG